MRLLRLISWPYLKKHAVRSLLTVIGIVLGVAVFVAMHTANQAVFFAFERTVDRIAGAAQLQVTAGEAGFPEEVLERVQAIPEVQVAVPVIEAPAGTSLSGQGNILILGVDMTGRSQPAGVRPRERRRSGHRRSARVSRAARFDHHHQRVRGAERSRRRRSPHACRR